MAGSPLMRRAVVLFGLLVACWSDRNAPSTTPVENHEPLAQHDRDLTGAYWCTIASGGYTYDAYPCVIRRVDNRFVLAKLGGSQRFTGTARPMREGFLFDGEFYCPWGDCTEHMHGVFAPRRGGLEYQDARRNLTVFMKRAPDDAFGGVAYGGDGYGGFGEWGGDGYGGATYGAPNRTGRRNPRP
jgi:hypothetical protein